MGFSKRVQLFLEIIACGLKESKVNVLRIETHLLAHKYMRNLWRRRKSKTVRIQSLDLDTLQLSKRVLRLLHFLLKSTLKNKKKFIFKQAPSVTVKKISKASSLKVTSEEEAAKKLYKRGYAFRKKANRTIFTEKGLEKYQLSGYSRLEKFYQFLKNNNIVMPHVSIINDRRDKGRWRRTDYLHDWSNKRSNRTRPSEFRNSPKRFARYMTNWPKKFNKTSSFV